MNQKYMLTALYAVLSISPMISASAKTPDQNDSLKSALSFINDQTNQASPAFDLLAKPRFEHVNAALDRIIQKATDDQALSNNADESINSIILKAREYQESLRQLYQSNPGRFLSDAELQRPDPKARVLPPIAQEAFPDEQQMVAAQTNSPYLEYTNSDDSELSAYVPEPSVYASEPSSEWGELHEGNSDNDFYYYYNTPTE